MKTMITQSPEWYKLQQDLGKVSFFEQGSGYQYLAIKNHTPVGDYLYLPYGPVYNDKKGYENSLKTLKLLAKREGAFFIRVEPIDSSFAENPPSIAVKSTDLNPKETWLLDLNGSDDELRSKLPSRLLRYYKAREKHNITIETSHNPDDIHFLLDFQRQLAKEKGINTFSEDYLKAELSQPFATLYLVRQDTTKSVIAAGLVFDDNHTRYNLQGAQSDEGRKLHATGILTIQLILDAKKKGLKHFDFWGIAPEGAGKDHPWAGFTNFKKTFAGYEVRHAGTYDLVLNRKKYRLYRLFRKFNRLFRNFKRIFRKSI